MFKMITTAYDGVTALLLSLPLVRTSNPVRDNATRGRGRTRDTINTTTKIKRERERETAWHQYYIYYTTTGKSI